MSTLLEQPRTAQRRVSPWLPILSASLPAGLLLFAAAMKWKQLPVIERMGNDLLHNPYFASAQILFESALALWLLTSIPNPESPSGLSLRVEDRIPNALSSISNLLSPILISNLKSPISNPLCRRVTLLTFSLFACITAYRGIAGEDSCGCFGQFKVNPWITFILDLSVIALLLASLRNSIPTGTISRPRSTAHDATAQRNPGIGLRGVVASLRETLFCSVFPVAAMLAVISLTIWRIPPTSPAGGTTGIVRAGNLLVLEPEKWPGKPLPILPYLEPRDAPTPALDQLTAGRWRLVIYNSECEHCRQHLPRLLRSIAAQPDQSQRYCFVQVPSNASEDEDLVPTDQYGPRARLTPREEWFASTPIILELTDGIVQSAAEGKAAEERMEDNLSVKE